jgi:hypothetical protein
MWLNLCHNVISLQKEEFMKCGQLAAKGLLQGSAGPKCFGKTVTDYMFNVWIQRWRKYLLVKLRILWKG